MTPAIFIPTLTAGGAERVASILANDWTTQASKVTVLLLFKDEQFFDTPPQVDIVCLGLRPNRGLPFKVIDLARALLALRRIVCREQPSFLLSFMNKYNVFCLAALLGTRVPIIVSERDSPTESGRGLTWLLRQMLYPRACGVITQSEDSKSVLLERQTNDNVVVIPNPIQLPSQREAEAREQIVLNVARLVPKKGHADLLAAFSRVGSDSWRLVICGDGPLRASLHRQAADLGIADRVDFLGTVRDLGYWYNRAKIFAFSSYFEGFPNALAEAMVYGVAPVTYDCPTGPSTIVRDGENGFLVPTGDVDALSDRLRVLMNDPSLVATFGERAKQISKVVSAPVVSRRYLDFCLSASRSNA